MGNQSNGMHFGFSLILIWQNQLSNPLINSCSIEMMASAIRTLFHCAIKTENKKQATFV